MKKILTLSCLFVIFLSNAQSVDVLEDKNGYKIFKLNSDKLDYINNLKLINMNDGFSTYNYQETVEYEIINELRYFKNKTSLTYLANKHSTTLISLKNLNPNMKDRKGYIKKTEIVLPIKKILRKNSIDNSLFNLFGEKVNLIYLTFENSSNKLKKISLNLDIKRSVQWLPLLGYNLKELYTEFENILGQNTEYPKPTSDCYKFKSQSCIYFEDRIFKGKILWKSKSIVLEIYHDVKPIVNYDGTSNLMVNRIISFEDRDYYKSKKLLHF